MPLWKRPGIWIGIGLWLLAGIIWIDGASRPSHAIAQSIPVPAATTNAFWAGYVTTSGAPYTEVQASWTVPSVSCSRQSGGDATVYAWIGEGGYLRGISSPLIQAGTASDCFAGAPRYHAFYEWYPGIYATDFPVAIRPGDRITARLQETAPNYWLLTVHDETNNAKGATATPFNADTGSADFVVERPTVCVGWYCSQVKLARFSPITFDSVMAQNQAGSSTDLLRTALPIALVDASGQESLAVPGRLATESDSLSVLWRRGT